jgi:hypothetical protein
MPSDYNKGESTVTVLRDRGFTELHGFAETST